MSSFLLRQTLGRVGIQRLAASSSSKACLTEAWRHVAASASSMQPQRYVFVPKSSLFHSTAFRAEESSETKEALVDLLNREYDEEIKSETSKLPEDLAKLKSQLQTVGWKIADNVAMTKMVRTTASGLKVQVSFHCQDMVESADEDENDTLEDEAQASMPIKFTVLVSKAGQTMVIGCMSEQAAVMVQNVAITSTGDDTILMNTGAVLPTDYQGPEFSELAEDVQYAFQDFVDVDLGIDGDVAAFIAMYADYTEQSQYVDFLKRATTLLK